MSDDEVDGLLEALQVSPRNVPLRRSAVRALLRTGRLADAETVIRTGLDFVPGDQTWQLALADVFLRQDKRGEAYAVFECLTDGPAASAAACLSFARALLSGGETEAAVRQYRAAVARDPDIADPSLEQQLGIGAQPADETPEGRIRTRGGDDADADAGDLAPERPKTTFADVGGMDAVKDEIRMKILHPLQHPELYRAYSKTIGGGILMYGPPGCGKTHLARATAGEVKAGFLSVGIADVLGMWLGESEKKLHELFDGARRNAPCVLFFDEVDALGASRADMRMAGGRHLINQFLSEMDGVGASNEGVLVLAATNAPWHVDSAFRRPGRFDRVLFVPPPDEPARASILAALLRGKPVGRVDFEALARRAKDLSGADLKGAVDLAVEQKLREAMRKGSPQPIETADLERALRQVKPSTAEWFASARNHALYANQGGLYDDVLRYLKLR